MHFSPCMHAGAMHACRRMPKPMLLPLLLLQLLLATAGAGAGGHGGRLLNHNGASSTGSQWRAGPGLKTDDAAGGGGVAQSGQQPKPCASVEKDGLCCNPGALNVGPMLHVANLTLKAAAAWCHAADACSGFTAKVNSGHNGSITQQCADTDSTVVHAIYFKTMLGGNADPEWSSWRKVNYTAPSYYCHKHKCLPCAVPGLAPCHQEVTYTQPDCFGQCNATAAAATEHY